MPPSLEKLREQLRMNPSITEKPRRSKHAAGAFTQSTGSDNDPISRHFCASPAADLKRESSGYVSLSAGGGVAVEALIMAAVGGLSGVKCHLALQSGGGSTGLGNSSKADCRELMGVFFWEFEEVK